jgi:small subunit ribosomal protein S18
MAQQRYNTQTGGSRSGQQAGRPGQQGGRDQRGGNGNTAYGRNQQNRRDPLKKKADPLKLRDITYVDYRDIRILERFLNDRGKLLPNRITGVSAKGQRTLETAVKHARHLALLPFVAEGMK